jgi:CubicO group peptidase (beta-lactamase class C family)
MTAGAVARGFEAVEAEFERNFAERGDVRAAFAAVRDGELIVDLWGGLCDRRSRRPWGSDTLQLIFSGTKRVAICLLILIERGQLRLDAPVADYWPEFARRTFSFATSPGTAHAYPVSTSHWLR